MALQRLDDFRRHLDLFVFFHLGSDALVRLEELDGGLRVEIEHSRVRPFSFELNAQQVSDFSRNPALLEEFMLDQLTQHRRGGLEL